MHCTFLHVFLLCALTVQSAASFMLPSGLRIERRSFNFHPPTRKKSSDKIGVCRMGRLHAKTPLTADEHRSKEQEESDRFVAAAMSYLQKRDPKAKVRRPRMGTDEYDLHAAYGEAPKFDIDFEHLAAVEERLHQEALQRGPSAADLFAEVKRKAIEKWRKHDTDVGSSEVQVAIADERVKYLTRHLLANKHDMSAKRGLQALVVARRKFLDDLYRRNPDKATLMAQELGIRFRPSGRVWDKTVKYAAYKNTKAKYYYTEDGRKKKVKK